MKKRNVAAETHSEVISTQSGAKSSKEALYYHLLSPHFIRRCTERKTVGGKKYGMVQWRQGINDAEYVRDRYNHLWEHLLAYASEGDSKDDNLGAIAWAVECLMEVERLAPDALKSIVGISDLFGESARTYHEEEMKKRS